MESIDMQRIYRRLGSCRISLGKHIIRRYVHLDQHALQILRHSHLLKDATCGKYRRDKRQSCIFQYVAYILHKRELLKYW